MAKRSSYRLSPNYPNSNVSNANNFHFADDSMRNYRRKLSEKPSLTRVQHADEASVYIIENDSNNSTNNSNDNDIIGNNSYNAKRSQSVFSTVSHYCGLDEIPRLENYCQEGAERPPLEMLHQPRKSIFLRWMQSNQNISDDISGSEGKKFGWVSGVFIPTFMNLLGAVIYLRMGWMTAQAGILLAVAQIIIGLIILSITCLSMTAICTNGQVGSGGFYFMISRSLGPETGTMFGIIYFITNAIMVAFNIVGTCEGVHMIFDRYNFGIFDVPSSVNDTRVLGLAILVLIIIIPFISLELEHKCQWILFIIVIASLIDYFVGAVMPPNEEQKSKGFIGWETFVFNENLLPKWDGESFFTVFAVYISSVSGDFTGATMSGTLADASVAIPKGTILAIIASSAVYMLFIIFLGSTILPYATGDINDFFNGTFHYQNRTCIKDSQFKSPCYGLINDYNTVFLSAALTKTGILIEPIIMAGLFAQTISSAMSSYISAPQIFQSLASDKVLPYIGWFAKGYGDLNEPRRGYILVFFIALAFIAIGDFNIIATVISNCYLASWCLLNVSCFHADFVCAPSFRPSFKWFNKWISLLCGILCFVLMFLFDWISSICLISIMILIWLYIYKIKPNVNWGTTTDAQIYKIALSTALKLNTTTDHVKTYRPSILLLAGDPSTNLELIQIGYKITKSSGMLIVSDIRTTKMKFKERCNATLASKSFLHANKIKCFYNLIESPSLSDGVYMQIQCAGLGKLKPNIVMLGYPYKWQQYYEKDLNEYFQIIHSALELHKSLVIYRNGFKRNSANSSLDSGIDDEQTTHRSFDLNSNSFSQDDYASKSNSRIWSTQDDLSDFPKVKKNLIDVWWLYDDGGLTTLLPYILSQTSQYKKCKLRIFTVAKKDEDVNLVKMNLSNLLTKFRIPYLELNVLSQLELPHAQSIERFKEISSKWVLGNDIDDPSQNSDDCHDDQSEIKLTNNSLRRFKEKTNKYIRLSELLVEHSINSSLIVMTLPIPRKNYCPASLYMSWLEILSGMMPPLLFVRGNQTNVLTFYCE